MPLPSTPVEVFCSSVDEDASFLESLERHLSILRRSEMIVTWYRRKVTAGGDWKHELDAHLNSASLILLLISPHFLASDYAYGVELRSAMLRHDNHEACVIPILLRPCDWEGAPFARLQMLPRNGRAVTACNDADEAFTEIAREIRAFLEGKQPIPSSHPGSERASNTYSVHIGEGKGIVIGDNAQVTQTFSERDMKKECP